MIGFQLWLEKTYPEIIDDPAHSFAKEKHDATGKVRKLSGLPYFTHPSNFASTKKYKEIVNKVFT